MKESASGTNDKIGSVSKLLGVFGSNTDALLLSLFAGSHPTSESSTPLRATRLGSSRSSTPEIGRSPGTPLDFATVLDAILTKLSSMDKRLGDIEAGLASKYVNDFFATCPLIEYFLCITSCNCGQRKRTAS